MPDISPYKIIHMFPTMAMWKEFAREYMGITPYRINEIEQNYQTGEEQKYQLINYWKTINGRDGTCNNLLLKANIFLKDKKRQESNIDNDNDTTNTVIAQQESPAPNVVQNPQQPNNGPSYMQYRIMLSNTSSKLNSAQFSTILTLYSYKLDNREFKSAHDLIFHIEDKKLWDGIVNSIKEKLVVYKELLASVGRDDLVQIANEFGRPYFQTVENEDVTTPMTTSAERLISQQTERHVYEDQIQPVSGEEVDTHKEDLPAERVQSVEKNSYQETSKTIPDDTICEGDIVVQPCPDATIFNNHLNDESIYDIKSSPKGRVLILNNNFQDTKSERTKSDRDVELMKELWLGMDCEVLIEEDKTAKEMYAILRDFTKSELHYDYAVAILMSHGSEGYIVGRDSKIIQTELVIKLFYNNHAVHLQNKPKLLFFQCCRGDEGDKGVSHDITDNSRSSDMTDEAMKIMCSKSDLLIVHSTLKGNVSFRDQNHGSWFLNAVANIFQREAKKMHVHDMITEARRVVSQRTSNTPQRFKSHECKQMVESTSYLNKCLYLFPGLPKKTTDV